METSGSLANCAKLSYVHSNPYGSVHWALGPFLNMGMIIPQSPWLFKRTNSHVLTTGYINISRYILSRYSSKVLFLCCFVFS